VISQRSALTWWLRVSEDIPAFWLLLALLGTNEKRHEAEHLDAPQVIPYETPVPVRLKSLSRDLGLFPREAGGEVGRE